jgi:hypothetical protein
MIYDLTISKPRSSEYDKWAEIAWARDAREDRLPNIPFDQRRHGKGYTHARRARNRMGISATYDEILKELTAGPRMAMEIKNPRRSKAYVSRVITEMVREGILDVEMIKIPHRRGSFKARKVSIHGS